MSEQPIAEQLGHLTILVEDMNYNMKVLAEGHAHLDQKMESLASGVEKIEKKVESYRDELKRDMLFTQQALKATRDELRNDIKNLDQKLTCEVQMVEKNLSSKIDSMTEVVEKHEEEIQLLKRASL